MKLVLIAALDLDGVIGKDGDLPWYLPADLRHFKETTLGKCVIMGRKTFDSIKRKPLPRRRNIVMTRESNFPATGCEVAHSVEEALALVQDLPDEEQVMIIGGARIYEEFLPHATTLILTRVQTRTHGDTFFPPYNSNEFAELSRVDFSPDEKNQHAMTFLTLERVMPARAEETS